VKRLTLRLPPDLSKRAVVLARKHKVSLSEYLLLSLETCIEAEEGGKDLPLAAEIRSSLRKRLAALRPEEVDKARDHEPRRAKRPNRR